MTLRTRDIRALQARAARSRCFAHPGLALQVLEGKIVCRKCNGSLKLESIPSETEKFMTGLTQSAAIHSKMTQKYGEWEMPGTTTTEVTDVALIEPTREDIERVGARFARQIDGFGSKLPVKDVTMAAQLAAVGFQHFHFNVLQGGLYLNLRGREFNAQRAMGNRFGGVTIEIQTDEVKKAAGVGDNEVMVKATLWEKDAQGNRNVRMEDFGRAGGNRDRNQPVAKANTLEMATARAKCRVLIAGAPLGVNIGTYSENVGVVAVSDGPEQVAALTEGTEYPAEDDSTPAPANVDTRTGEIKNNNTPEKLQEVVDRLKASGITKEQVDSLAVQPSQMLIEGMEPHFIADAISAQLTPPETASEVRVEGSDEVVDLPW